MDLLLFLLLFAMIPVAAWVIDQVAKRTWERERNWLKDEVDDGEAWW